MLDANHRQDVDESAIDGLERIYDEAVCAGGALSARPVDEERLDGALELLAQITTRTPYLALVVVELAGAAETAAVTCLAREARRHAALAIRLAHRALEVHARDVGYELGAWRRRAVLEAGVTLTDSFEDLGDELGVAAAGLGDASDALAHAIVAVPTDRMAVPGHLARALGAWLACYVCAEHASLGR